MGMYTHLRLDVEVYPKYKDEVLAYIDSVPRLRCTSYYFYDRGQNFIEEDDMAKCPVESGSTDVSPMCILHTDISCKNYGGEIEAFLEFLSGKLVNAGYDGECAGMVRYEEDLIPDLLFLEKGNIVRKTVTVNERA